MTLKRTSRSMPAMPIAESRPPIVVGISVTSSAARTVTVSTVPRIAGKPPERDDGDQEDQRQARQQDRQRDLVRGLLPLGAFDQRNHAVDEAGARRNGDADFQPVGQHLRAAGHRRAVAAGFADDRGGLAGDRAFVDRGDAFDDLAVAGDQFAGLDDHQVADLEVGRRYFYHVEAVGLDQLARGELRLGAAQAVGLRLAAPFGDGFGEGREQHREPQPDRDLAGEERVAVADDDVA